MVMFEFSNWDFCSLGDDKKKGRAGKIHKVTKASYFTYSSGSPLWTDFDQFLQNRRYARCNRLSKFWCEKNYAGLEWTGGRSLGSPIKTAGQPYNSATADLWSALVAAVCKTFTAAVYSLSNGQTADAETQPQTPCLRTRVACSLQLASQHTDMLILANARLCRCRVKTETTHWKFLL